MKTTRTIKTELPYSITLMLLIAGIITKLRAAVKIEVPVGYQDETGFHFGVKNR